MPSWICHYIFLNTYRHIKTSFIILVCNISKTFSYIIIGHGFSSILFPKEKIFCKYQDEKRV